MKLEYYVSKEDYLQYCMYSYEHSDIVKKQIMMVRFIFLGLITLITPVIFYVRLSEITRREKNL